MGGLGGKARCGADVMVKPPGLGEAEVKTSSHCPGRNCVLVSMGMEVKDEV